MTTLSDDTTAAIVATTLLGEAKRSSLTATQWHELWTSQPTRGE